VFVKIPYFFLALKFFMNLTTGRAGWFWWWALDESNRVSSWARTQWENIQLFCTQSYYRAPNRTQCNNCSSCPV